MGRVSPSAHLRARHVRRHVVLDPAMQCPPSPCRLVQARKTSVLRDRPSVRLVLAQDALPAALLPSPKAALRLVAGTCLRRVDSPARRKREVDKGWGPKITSEDRVQA